MSSNQSWKAQRFQRAMEEISNFKSDELFVEDTKGVPKHTSTNSDLLDCSVQLIRGAEESIIHQKVKGICEQATNCNDPNLLVDLIVLMFQKRNCRGGEGERDIFYQMFITFYKYFPEIGREIIFSNVIAHYGYYGDYTKLVQFSQKELDSSPNENVSDLITVILSKMAELFISNGKLYKEDPNTKSETALFFKWLPREGLSLDKNVVINVNHNDKCYQLHFVKALIATIYISQDKPFPQNKKEWGMALKSYRKVIQSVMKTLNVPETFMCAGDWNLIDPKNVPSRASMIYRKAFFNINKDGTMRSYEDTRVECAEKFIKALKEGAIKGAQCLPHELLTNAKNAKGVEKMSLIAQYENLRLTIANQIIVMMLKSFEKGENIKHMIVNFIPVSDISSSMEFYKLKNSKYTPMDVSISLGTFFSDFTHYQIDVLKSFSKVLKQALGVTEFIYSQELWSSVINGADATFKEFVSEYLFSMNKNTLTEFLKVIDSINKLDYVTDLGISFSESPHIIYYSNMTHLERMNELYNHCGYNTNFKAVHEVLINQCTIHKIPSENIPTLIVFSDGEFDYMNTSGNSDRKWETSHEYLTNMWVTKGFSGPPNIVYWNLNLNTVGFHTNSTHPGVQMVSGFSPAMMRGIMLGQTGETITSNIVIDGEVKEVKTSSLTPIETLYKTLNDPIYDKVREILSDCNEGILYDYKFQTEENNSSNDTSTESNKDFTSLF